MDYVYSQDPNTKLWTCRQQYSGMLKVSSGSGKTHNLKP